jgi:hypothetical protein
MSRFEVIQMHADRFMAKHVAWTVKVVMDGGSFMRWRQGFSNHDEIEQTDFRIKDPDDCNSMTMLASSLTTLLIDFSPQREAKAYGNFLMHLAKHLMEVGETIAGQADLPEGPNRRKGHDATGKDKGG